MRSCSRPDCRSFDAVMGSSGGRCLRVLEDRENWYLRLRRDRRRRRRRLLEETPRPHLVDARCGPSSAPVRASRPPGSRPSHAGSLSALGIDVMRLVAYGERLRSDGMLESFLLTEELAGYVELQEFLCGGGFRPSAARRAAATRTCGGSLDQVADIARRFHAAGFNHRDFYCCHFLVKETSPGEFDVRLIDLQRVAAAALVPAALDRQGPGPIGQLGPARSRRLQGADRLAAPLPGRAEAARRATSA